MLAFLLVRGELLVRRAFLVGRFQETRQAVARSLELLVGVVESPEAPAFTCPAEEARKMVAKKNTNTSILGMIRFS